MDSDSERGLRVRSKIWIEILSRPVLGPGRTDLLRAIDQEGSISRAAQGLNITYRKAWGQIKTMEEQVGRPLVVKQTGGAGGGGTRLTAAARDLLSRYEELTRGMEEMVNRKFQEVFFVSR